MKISILSVVFCSAFWMATQGFALTTEHPAGDISFYNSSSNNVRAEVSASAKFSLAAKEQKTVPYSVLSQACAASPTNCKAQFFINDTPAGSARINVVTGKLLSMNLHMKVNTSKGSQEVLRSVVIH